MRRMNFGLWRVTWLGLLVCGLLLVSRDLNAQEADNQECHRGLEALAQEIAHLSRYPDLKEDFYSRASQSLEALRNSDFEDEMDFWNNRPAGIQSLNGDLRGAVLSYYLAHIRETQLRRADEVQVFEELIEASHRPESLVLLTHQLDEPHLEEATFEVIDEVEPEMTILLAEESTYIGAEVYASRSDLVLYSKNGELPFELQAEQVHLMGGFWFACEARTLRDLIFHSLKSPSQLTEEIFVYPRASYMEGSVTVFDSLGGDAYFQSPKRFFRALLEMADNYGRLKDVGIEASSIEKVTPGRYEVTFRDSHSRRSVIVTMVWSDSEF